MKQENNFITAKEALSKTLLNYFSDELKRTFEEIELATSKAHNTLDVEKGYLNHLDIDFIKSKGFDVSERPNKIRINW